jgi:hypothetical protein
MCSFGRRTLGVTGNDGRMTLVAAGRWALGGGRWTLVAAGRSWSLDARGRWTLVVTGRSWSLDARGRLTRGRCVLPGGQGGLPDCPGRLGWTRRVAGLSWSAAGGPGVVLVCCDGRLE